MVSNYNRLGAAVAGLALLVSEAGSAIAQDYKYPLNGLPGFQNPTAPRGLPGFSYPPKSMDLPGFSSPQGLGNLPGFNSPPKTERNLPDFDPTKESLQCAGIAGYVKKHGRLTAGSSNPIYILNLSEYGFVLKLVLNNDNPHDEGSSLEIKLKALTFSDAMCRGQVNGTKEDQRKYSDILNWLFSLMYEPKKPKKMA